MLTGVFGGHPSIRPSIGPMVIFHWQKNLKDAACLQVESLSVRISTKDEDPSPISLSFSCCSPSARYFVPTHAGSLTFTLIHRRYYFDCFFFFHECWTVICPLVRHVFQYPSLDKLNGFRLQRKCSVKVVFLFLGELNDYRDIPLIFLQRKMNESNRILRR